MSEKKEYPVFVAEPPPWAVPKHNHGRMSSYREHVRTMRRRLEFVDKKEAEWKQLHPGDHPASYFKTERETILWVLELISFFLPEENRPPGAPIPVLADDCPACHTTVRRKGDGHERQDPWRCPICGHQYPAGPAPEETL